jgi:tetratricopeptide (TPR) repeat protein
MQPGVFIVQTDSLFCAHAPHGIPDSTLFLEHLHPNVRGYQLLAYGFFERLKKSRAQAGTPTHSFPPHCQNFTRLDEAIGALKIADLVSKPPFNGRTHFGLPAFSPEEILEIAREHVYGTLLWDAAHFKMGGWYARHKDWQRALEEYFAVLEADSHHVAALYHIGDIYVQIGSPEKALAFYRKGIKSDPNLAFLKAKLARALVLSGNVLEALNVIHFLLNDAKMRRQFNERQLEGLNQLETLARRMLQRSR